MSILPTIEEFPTVPIDKQFFSVPGAVQQGGFTSGGVRISSPEPGGFGMLQIKLAFQVKEWDEPTVSWLSSKGAGEIFRVKLTKTPQIVGKRVLKGFDNNLSNSVPWSTTINSTVVTNKWSNNQFWNSSGTIANADNIALAGETKITINFDSAINYEELKKGHLIGHLDNTYLIVRKDVDVFNKKTILTVKPPLRNDIAVDDIFYFEPYFVGEIIDIANAKNI
jgi:hypothetical protein